MEKQVFGKAFRRELDAAMNEEAPGARSDGTIIGVDIDREVKAGVEVRPPVRNYRAEWGKKTKYPTTRMGRAVRGIQSILKEGE